MSSALVNRQFKQKSTKNQTDSSKLMFNNFLNQIDSSSNVAFKAKDSTSSNNQTRSGARPPTMNASGKF